MNTRILTFLALLLTSVCGASSACAEALTTMDSVEHVASKHTLVNLNAALWLTVRNRVRLAQWMTW